MISRHNRVIGTIGVVTLVAGLLLAPPAAAAAPTVDLTFLNINDFHGRIDANTVKFAGTVEKERAAAEGAGGAVAFLAAGDNIGASLFASASAKDQPTIDVLNALNLDASAVGNHEFDQGFDDLTNRVIANRTNAKWDYLGANVYEKGTTTPALPEYKILDMGGVTVGVIGAVTKETSSLVSPAGIANLEFGDPVDAVNRVAAQLTDGIADNGEAEVLVAEYHEGASEGTPDGATLDEELAAGGAFAKIVTETSPRIAAIFTGHTHKEYAWDAPIPGQAGKTRPILQTGSYGANIGEIKLTVDAESRQVTAYTAQNVKQVTTDDATLISTYPRVSAVNTIVQKALADAAAIGNQPVGSVTADITTAYSGAGAGYTGPGNTYQAPTRDDRSKESTLGNLVANSLVTSLSDPARGGATIGVVNPGGLRAELLYAPDGVITYAEANGVLPFVNNLWTTSLTGAQFKTLLEQQWQTNPDGTIPTRPYLQLGLSDNVSYTYDPAAAQGSHITSISVEKSPIDPAKTYRIGTFSFLTSGGDNFRIFTEGTNPKDSGLIDRDAWIDYLDGHPDLAPDFARHAVAVPAVAPVDAGAAVQFQVSGLDLTSLGSPQNTSLTIQLISGEGPGEPIADLGTAPVSNGAAQVSVTIPPSAPVGAARLLLTATPSDTAARVPITVTAPAPTTTVTLTASPASQIYGSPNRVTLTATVKSSDGSPVSGTVDFHNGDKTLGSAPIDNGVAAYQLASDTDVGTLNVTASVDGAQSDPLTVTVNQAGSLTLLLSTASSYRQGAFLPAILLTGVGLNNGQSARGKVQISVDGQLGPKLPLTYGLAIYLPPRSLAKGKHTFVATFEPTDSTNIAGSSSRPVVIQVR